MIGRTKKPEAVQRSPHINRQKQSSFQYSSNRSYSERTVRENPDQDPPLFSLPSLRLAAFKLGHMLIVIGFFGTVILLSLLFTKPQLQAEGDMIRSQDTYNEALAGIVGTGLLSHSKLTVSRTEITAKIEQQFPELQNVDVSTPLFSTSVRVKAQVAKPTMMLIANGSNYLIDVRGIALATTDNTHVETDGLLRLEDQTGAPITVGKPALTSPQVTFISELQRQSDAKQLTIDQMFLVAGGGELDVRYLGSAYIVKYNLYEDARKSFGTFYASKEYLERTKAIPAEYIDVRVAERAYTK